MLSFSRALAAALTVVVLAGAVVTAHAAGEAKKRAAKYQESNEEKIYDLITPWPWKEGAPEGDMDGDGVMDENDRCPSTPRGAIVDANGCPSDSDNDGVVDGVDRCPNTAAGAKVDGTGCPSDADRDGIADGVDQCPNTPRGASVDAKGCPSDSDNDGVYNGIDKCADTPREYAVDDDGCPIPIGEVGQKFLDSKAVAFNIDFASGKADILPSSEDDLNKVGEALSEWSDAEVEIRGYTDSQGTESFNKTLSKRRADSVKQYLVTHYPKINAKNLTPKGFGEADPIADNATEEGRAQNRRVEFQLTNADKIGKQEVDTRRYKKRAQ